MTRTILASQDRAASQVDDRKEKQPPRRRSSSPKPVNSAKTTVSDHWLKSWPAFTDKGVRVDKDEFVTCLLKRYKRLILSAFGKYLNDRTQIEDAFGDLSVSVIKRFNNSPDKPIFATERWLYLSAIRRAVKILNKRQPTTCSDFADVAAREDESRILAQEAVADALHILDPREQTVILRVMYGYKQFEIAGQLECSPRTISNAYQSALRKMRLHMELDQES